MSIDKNIINNIVTYQGRGSEMMNREGIKEALDQQVLHLEKLIQKKNEITTRISVLKNERRGIIKDIAKSKKSVGIFHKKCRDILYSAIVDY